MKKISLLLSLVLIASLFSACGSGDNTSADTTVTDETSQEQLVEIKVAKDSLADVDEFLGNMKSYGAEAKDSADGNSYVLTFTGEEHKKLLDDKRAEITKAFKGYEEDENHYIDSIEYDEDFRNLVFNVNKDLYNASTDETNNILIAAKVLIYQMYLGVEQKADVKVVYTGTEEEVKTFTLPIA